MKRKLTALLAAILFGAGGAVAVGAPAQAWGYCTPVQSTADVFNFYRAAGYCGVRNYVAPQFGWCYTLVGTPYNEWIGAVWNRTNYTVTIFQGDGCQYGYNWMDVAPQTSDPDLTNNGLYRTVSSLKFHP